MHPALEKATATSIDTNSPTTNTVMSAELKRSSTLQRSRHVLSEYEEMTQPMALDDMFASLDDDAGGHDDQMASITCKADLLRTFPDDQIKSMLAAWRLGTKKRSAAPEPAEPAQQAAKRVKTTADGEKTFFLGLPSGVIGLKGIMHDRYREAIVGGQFVVHEDDVVQVVLEETHSRYPPLARIDALFLDAETRDPSALVTWFYGSDEVPLSDGEKKKAGLRDGEYSLSNHSKQALSLATLECIVPEEKLDLVLFYDCEQQQLRLLDTEVDWPSKHEWASQRLLLRTDMELFRDCLGHAKAVREKSAFWRRMEDTLLRPGKDIGRDSNPQRNVLEQLGYERLKTAKLDRPMQTKCFCCHMTRHCTYKLVEPDGDAKDAVRAIGSYCEARITRVARFLKMFNSAYEVYQEAKGDVDDKELKPILCSMLDLFRAQDKAEPDDL